MSSNESSTFFATCPISWTPIQAPGIFLLFLEEVIRVGTTNSPELFWFCCGFLFCAILPRRRKVLGAASVRSKTRVPTQVQVTPPSFSIEVSHEWFEPPAADERQTNVPDQDPVPREDEKTSRETRRGGHNYSLRQIQKVNYRAFYDNEESEEESRGRTRRPKRQ